MGEDEEDYPEEEEEEGQRTVVPGINTAMNQPWMGRVRDWIGRPRGGGSPSPAP